MEKQKRSWGRTLLLAFQHVFAMFGATVLVPYLTGLPVSVALFTAGVGTWIFHSVTRFKVPVFLGSSFAFITAIQSVCIAGSEQLSLLSKNDCLVPLIHGNFDAISEKAASLGIGADLLPTLQQAYLDRIPYALGGLLVAGALYLVLSLLIKIFGVQRVKSFFPPVVTGPMIIVIGLTLAPSAINNIISVGNIGWLVALAVILTMIIVSVLAKGIFKLVPILFGIVVGYAVCMVIPSGNAAAVNTVGLVDFSSLVNSSIIELPKFTLPKLEWTAILAIAPLALVTFMEHIGDITTNGSVVGQDFTTDPGLHRTLLGDGLATMFASFVGGPANTTYSENTSVLAVTKNYDPFNIRLAAIFSVLFSFIGWFNGFIQTIPAVVMGSVSLFLYGMIASVGIRTIASASIDFSNSRNLIIVSLMLVMGLGGAAFNIALADGATLVLSGMALSAIVGIVLNKALPENLEKRSKKQTKDENN